ncbi:MAG: MarR family transcriptional regulator [Rhodospirillales bacterium]|nr:MarR family transcriptional regulator [Rhodospirillales bacterium]
MVALKTSANPLFLREEELRRGIELMFYAYREFTSEPDRILAKIDLGRAHHRAIYFIGRYPGITVSELLAILKITKQSLSRVLGQLLERGYVEQAKGERDQRQRLLTLTEAGHALEQQLTNTQRCRFAAVYKAAGAEAVAGFRAVLAGIIDPTDLERVERLLSIPQEEKPEATKRLPVKCMKKEA